MSLLHRSVLASILAAIDPLIEVGAAIVNPIAGAGAKLVLTDVESIVNGSVPASAAAPVAVVVPASTPTAAAPAPVVAPQLSGLSTEQPAPAPLTAADVIAALMKTLTDLQARA